jgi:hypothetical protein
MRDPSKLVREARVRMESRAVGQPDDHEGGVGARHRLVVGTAMPDALASRAVRPRDVGAGYDVVTRWGLSDVMRDRAG